MKHDKLWEIIAYALTKKWYNEGILPIIYDGQEYNYVYYIADRFNNNKPGILRFAHTSFYYTPEDSGIHTYGVHHAIINKKDALLLVWNDLTNNEKTDIMSWMLGQND